jgi:cyclopropane fatty-acyl-phospholipid synthase-like methyltransferase
VVPDDEGIAMTRPAAEWDASYQGSPAPWDIGRPQAAFVRLAEAGLLSGRLLDAGCGTGEHVLLAAAHGADAMGVDLSGLAIEKARAKAAERGLTARFEAADALHLELLGERFGTVIDSGLFHVFDDGDRPSYVTSLAAVVEPGGSYYMMCFSDQQPGAWGPHRVREEEIRAAFTDGWEIVSLTPDQFSINPIHGNTVAQAWLAVIRRR